MRFISHLCSLTAFVTTIAAKGLGPPTLPKSEMLYIYDPSDHLEPMSPGFTALFDTLCGHHSSSLEKRDFESTLESLLKTFQSSGIIMDVLHEIASSTDEMNTLSNYIYQILVSALTNTALLSLNITVNLTDIVAQVEASGIVTSTFADLLLDDTQRDIFADNLAEVMANNTWIPTLVFYLGDKGKISWETIFDIARDTPSKDPGFNGTLYTYKSQRLLRRSSRNLKRDDSSSGNYTGSLQSFLHNVLGSALGSDLFSHSLELILEAVKNSGVVVPTIQLSLADSQIQLMVGFIANKLYNYGVFDQIPINDYFQNAKKNGVILKYSKYVLSTDLGSEISGKIFLRLMQSGVYEQIRTNMYGPN